MLRIEPLGTGIILPAFVVGYELSDESDALVCALDGAFPWMLILDQQAGGYCMSYPSVFGCILRFSDNSHFCRSSVVEVVRGFQAMAEDPNLNLLRSEYPELVSLVCTRGDNYKPEQLNQLQQYLKRCFHIPPLEAGIEAFVRMAHCDPMAYFANWKILSAIPKTESRELYRGQTDTYIDDSSVSSLHLSADLEFSDEKLLLLRNAGRQLRVNRHDRQPTDHLRVFLLWENSD